MWGTLFPHPFRVKFHPKSFNGSDVDFSDDDANFEDPLKKLQSHDENSYEEEIKKNWK